MSPIPPPETKNWRDVLIGLPRYPKRVVLVLVDLSILGFALWVSLSLRLSVLYVPPNWKFALVLAAAPIAGVVTFYMLGLYRLVTRYIGPQGATRIFFAVAASVLVWSLVVVMANAPGVLPRASIVMYAILSGLLVYASRQLAGWILRGVPYATPARFNTPTRNVVIYGAGTTGVQLLQALQRSPEYNPVGFIDENSTLWGQMLGGLKVYRPHKIAKLMEREEVREILLAIPEASRHHRRSVIESLESLGVVVKTLPAIEDIASGKVRVSDLREINADDLLGRDPILPDKELLAHSVTGRSVMVTGAGGSIGSELTRQILKLHPSRLVLLDVSEAALYEIHAELIGATNGAKPPAAAGPPADPARVPAPETEIVAVLGSVLDPALVQRTLALHRVQSIYHAAAYKHVPIVEQNPVVGLKNNTWGTSVLATAAREAGVERVVLISTDKAVRPTNIMGASKRLAELVLQAQSAEPGPKPIFTIVRFGNVLDSSGSVVRRFRRQIIDGGPVTVTHPEIIRYFMSIPEAAELVLQAGAMAKGGEVFVLDMGEPVKIDNLARSMIRLMGLEVRDAANPQGDIAIAYTGLRPGEKLYEELLISEGTTTTQHPRILRFWEPALTSSELARELDALQQAMALGALDAIDAVLLRTVEGYHPDARSGKPAAEAADWRASGRRTLH